MAEGKSQLFAHNILKLLRNVPLSPPAGGYFLGLGSTIPTSTGVFTELSGNNYARIPAPPSVWGVPAQRRISNVSELEYAIVQTAAWPTTLAVALYEALTGGSAAMFGQLELGRTPGINDSVYFDAGDISFLESQEIERKSTLLAHLVLGLLRGDAILPPEQLWIGVGTARTITNESIQELTVPGYKRARYYPGEDFWLDPANRATHNLQQIIFDKAPSNLPDIWSFGIFTTETGGSPWWFGNVDQALVLKQKDKLRILPQGIVVVE